MLSSSSSNSTTTIQKKDILYYENPEDRTYTVEFTLKPPKNPLVYTTRIFIILYATIKQYISSAFHVENENETMTQSQFFLLVKDTMHIFGDTNVYACMNASISSTSGGRPGSNQFVIELHKEKLPEKMNGFKAPDDYEIPVKWVRVVCDKYITPTNKERYKVVVVTKLDYEQDYADNYVMKKVFKTFIKQVIKTIQQVLESM